MNKYKKLTVVDFKKKLNDNQYENLTGARRAIGKVQGWSEEERDKARKVASAFFGEETAAPKKAAKKTAKVAKAGKPGPKKGAKKAAKAPKAKAAKKTGAKPGPKKGSKRGPRKVAAQGDLVKASAGDNAGSANRLGTTFANHAAVGQQDEQPVVPVMTHVVNTISEAVKAMKMSRDMSSTPGKYDVEIDKAVRVLGKAIDTLHDKVFAPITEQVATTAPTVAVSADKPKIKKVKVKAAEETKPEELETAPEEEGTDEQLPTDVARTPGIARFAPGSRPIAPENMERLPEEQSANGAIAASP